MCHVSNFRFIGTLEQTWLFGKQGFNILVGLGFA